MEDFPSVRSDEEEEEEFATEGFEEVENLTNEKELEEEKINQTPEHKYLRKLSFSEEWGDSPCIEDQEHHAPDTVRHKKYFCEVLNLNESSDISSYSNYLTSHYKNQKYIFFKNPQTEYNTSSNTWEVLLHIIEREFKQA